MSDSPIFDNVDKPTPIYGKITNPVPVQPVNDHGVVPPKKWWQKTLTKPFRRWAYGLTAAAVVAGATWAGKPEFIPVIGPLLMALFFVDHDGEPKDNA